MKRQILSVILCFLVQASYASDEGKRIYLEGRGSDGEIINALINDLPSTAPLACVNCHRESGLGTSESGKTIPPVSWTFLGENQPVDESSRFYNIQNKRKAYNSELLHRLLITGINSNGEQADPLMPRYVLNKSQSEQIKAYLATLFVSNDPGVDDEKIRIATIIDPRLSTQQKQQHREFLQGLFKMKNSRTRGEIRRKQFSPIQKVPQYESYRHWELVEWELSEDPDLWTKELTAYYKSEPVFVVLSPWVKDSYKNISIFCNDYELPCLFAQGTGDFQGDYYNFVYRNTQKQQRDYLVRHYRENSKKLFFADADGKVKKVLSGDTKIPRVESTSFVTFQRELKDVCADNIHLLIKPDAELAMQLVDFSCPQKQQMRILFLKDDVLDYQFIATLLKNTRRNSNFCWVTDYDKVLKRNSRKIRVDVLTRKFNMEDLFSENLAMSLFAFGLLTDSMHQLAGNFSRPYLMEIMEHMLNSYPNYTYFSSVSGAPNQRAIVGSIKEFCPTAGASS